MSLSTLLIIFLCLSGLSGLFAADHWQEMRIQARLDRQSLADNAVADRRERGKKASVVIDELIEVAKSAPVQGQKADLLQLLVGLNRLDAVTALARTAQVNALVEPRESSATQTHIWQSTLKRKREELLKPTLALGERALKIGAITVAYECFRDLFAFEPDRAPLRSALGQQYVRGRWYGHHDSEIARKGLDWNDKLGWVVAGAESRYAAGEYFDVPMRAWTSQAAADRYHADPKTPWVIRTEHVEITGTAELVYLVDTANALESFYAQIFASYAAFFYEPGKADMRVVFAVTDHPALAVHIAADEKQYKTSLPTGIDAGWTAGMFVPATHTAYFYALKNKSVMYHEFTHQILHEFTGTDRAPAWLIEGIAVYTQSPTWHDGDMQLGDAITNYQLFRYVEQSATGKAKTAKEVMTIEDSAKWLAATDPDANYPAAGMVVHCLMEAEDRRYRADFIDYIRDSYQEVASHSLWEYLHLDPAAFDKLFADHVKELQSGHQ